MPRAAEVGVRGSRRGRKKKNDRARKKGDEVSSEGARARKVDGSTAILFSFSSFSPFFCSCFPRSHYKTGSPSRSSFHRRRELNQGEAADVPREGPMPSSSRRRRRRSGDEKKKKMPPQTRGPRRDATLLH